MALDATDWEIERDTGAITYTGDDHTGTAPTYATVIEFHRWLQELSDDAYATAGNADELDMTELSPSARSTDNIITLLNGYFIDATAAEHLYDGSIIQEETYGTTIYDGIVNFGNKGVLVQIHQNGAVLSDDWWNYNVVQGAHDGGAGAEILTDGGETWTTDEWIGYWIYNTTDSSRGLITDNDGTTITADLQGGTLNNWQIGDTYLIAKGVNEDLTQGITHRFMVRTKYNDAAIDQFKLIGTTRGFHRSYGEFKINATGRGNNVLALSDANDINNTTAEETVGTWTGITNTEGYRNIDVNNDGTDEYYYSEWDKSTYSINQFYERMKWLTRDGSASTQNGLNGELFRGITHSFVYDNDATITIATNDVLVWGTLIDVTGRAGGDFTVGDAVFEDVATPGWGGTVIAMDATNDLVLVDVEFGTPTTADAMRDYDDTVTDASITVSDAAQTGAPGGAIAIFANDATGNELWGQVTKGGSPVDNTRLYHDTDLTDLCDVAGTVTERTVGLPWCGISTGSALIGAYGFAVEYNDLTDADKMTALDGVVYTPPNNVTNTVAGLVHDEDYVIVAPWDGSTTDVNGDPAIQKDQLTLATLLNADNITQVDVTASTIPADTPSSGYIRVVDNNGYDRRLHYTSWTTSTPDYFTVDTTDGQEDFLSVNASATNDVYITYLDQLTDSDPVVNDGSLVVDTVYVITTVGTSNFVTVGAATNTIGTVFTATGTDSGGNGTVNTYYWTHSFTGVYDADDDLVVIVRDGGGSAKGDTPIKQFISSWSFTSSNQTLTAIRTTDE